MISAVGESDPSRSPTSPAALPTLAFFFATSALQLTDNQVMPLLLDRLEAVVWPGRESARLLAAYALGAAVGPLLLTRLAPFATGRRTVALALGLLGCAQGAFALAPPFGTALGLRALAGAASGVISYALLMQAVIVGGGAVAALTAGFLFAYVTAIPSGAKLVATFGLPTLFLTLAAVGTALAVVALGRLPAPRPRPVVDAPHRSLWGFLREPRLRSGLLASLLIGAALAGPVSVFPKRLAAEGASLDTIANIYYLAGLGPLLALPAVAMLRNRWILSRQAQVGAVAVAIPILALPATLSQPWMAGAVLLITLTVETIRRSALQSVVAGLPSPAEQSRYLALRNVAVQVSIAGSLALSAELAKESLLALCGGAAVLCVVSAVLIPHSASH